MNSSTDLVSIITPTYNCASFIGRTIECVLRQTYTNWELLIVDDCSSDETKEIVKDFVQRDSRIKYFKLDSKSGTAIARNHALSLASGHYIAFLDSDDLWVENKLEKQIRFMKEHGIKFSYTQYEEIDEHDNPRGRLVTGPSKISKVGMFSYCWPGCLTVMYERDTVGTISIPALQKNNDYAMWLKVIRKSDCYLLPENLAKYRKREGSTSNSSYLSLIKWHYRLFRVAESANHLLACILTLNNLVWGVTKKMIYVKKL
ncbi:MAG: glycosyltransferase family 2 protein [Bacteroidales bacterium]|nr:glycosyltransferase family 2 protein [Bacteroidales bacterium]